MKPTVGRIVHYHPFGSDEPEAAIITEVRKQPGPLGLIDDYSVSITVFPASIPIERACVLGPTPFGEKPGCWSWPPRVS